MERGGRPKPPGPDALAFQAGTRRRGSLRRGESYSGRRLPRTPVERADTEVAGDHGGIAGGLRPGQLLLPHVPGRRRRRRPAGEQPHNGGRAGYPLLLRVGARGQGVLAGSIMRKLVVIAVVAGCLPSFAWG